MACVCAGCVAYSWAKHICTQAPGPMQARAGEVCHMNVTPAAELMITIIAATKHAEDGCMALHAITCRAKT